jgi:hypothetical protein
MRRVSACFVTKRDAAVPASLRGAITNQHSTRTAMRILKKILFGLLILIVVVLIAGLFMANEFAIEREVAINKPKDEVFAYVKSLKNQNNYSKWALVEPGMKKSFRGTDGTVGFVSAWEGDKVGKGEQEIRNIAEGQQIDYELRFEKPFKSTAHTHMTTEALSEGQTKVKWGFSGSNKYPMNVMNGLMKWSLGNDLQKGLNNLKDILEKGQIAEAR